MSMFGGLGDAWGGAGGNGDAGGSYASQFAARRSTAPSASHAHAAAAAAAAHGRTHAPLSPTQVSKLPNAAHVERLVSQLWKEPSEERGPSLSHQQHQQQQQQQHYQPPPPSRAFTQPNLRASAAAEGGSGGGGGGGGSIGGDLLLGTMGGGGGGGGDVERPLSRFQSYYDGPSHSYDAVRGAGGAANAFPSASSPDAAPPQRLASGSAASSTNSAVKEYETMLKQRLASGGTTTTAADGGGGGGGAGGNLDRSSVSPTKRRREGAPLERKPSWQPVRRSQSAGGPSGASGGGDRPAAAAKRAAAQQLAGGGGGPPTDLYSRTELWRQSKENQLALMRERRLSEEAGKCTFAPAVNREAPSGGGRHHEGDVVSRLYTSRQHTRAVLEGERRKQMEEEEEACTFRPAVNRSAWVEHVEPRYLNPSRRHSGRTTEDADLFDSETDGDGGGAHDGAAAGGDAGRESVPSFQPKINSDFQPQNIGHYLATNAFARLSSVHGQTGSGGGGGVVIGRGRSSSGRREGRGGQQRASSEFVVSGYGEKQRTSGGAGGGKQIGKEELDGFFQRMEAHEERRLEGLERIVQSNPSVRPTFTPRLNTKSKGLMSSRGGGQAGDFSARMALDAQKRERRQQRTERQKSVEEEAHTYKPTITLSARSLRARSVEELSTGDRQRKEEKLKRKARERYEKEQRDCTFKPQLNDSTNIQSKISVKTDPMGYIQWAKTRQDQRRRYLEQEKEKEAEKENEICTFKPKVHTAPGYVSQIAASLHLAKPLERQDDGPKHTFGYA